MVRNNKAMIL